MLTIKGGEISSKIKKRFSPSVSLYVEQCHICSSVSRYADPNMLISQIIVLVASANE